MPSSKDKSRKWINFMFDEFYNDYVSEIYAKSELRLKLERLLLKNVSQVNWMQELKWLQETIESLNSPLVFSHSDFNRNNILVQEKPFDIFFVDFDYTGYNFRGIDLGKYFSSWGQKDATFGYGQYPTDENMSPFLNAYIEECIQQKGNNYAKHENNSISCLIKESKVFSLVSYMFDALFCLWFSQTDQNKETQFLVGL